MTTVSTLLQHVPPRSVTSWFRHASLIRSRAGSPRLASRTFRYACRLVRELAFEAEVKYEAAIALLPKKKLGESLARFRYVGNGAYSHRDALEFPSGEIVLLTRLCDGQRATVLQLPAIPHVEHAHANDEQALVTVG